MIALRQMLEALPGLVTIVVLIATGTLHDLATRWLIGFGWAAFGGWLALATLASPLRVRDEPWPRRVLHTSGWVLAWSWWLLAIYPADLATRRDQLWLAYFVSALVMAGWLVVAHGFAFRRLVRGALREAASGNAVVQLVAPGPAPSPRPELGRVRSVLLRTFALVRAFPPFALLHRSIFGRTGTSRIALEEAQRATDVRLAMLRMALAAPERRRLERPALALARAFACEAAIIARTLAPPRIDARVVQGRLMAVLEPLMLAWLARNDSPSMSAALAAFDAGYASLRTMPGLAPLPEPSVATFLGGALDGPRLFELTRAPDVPSGEPLVTDVPQQLVVATACIDRGYVRLANSMLGRVVRDFDHDGVTMLGRQAVRSAHALGVTTSGESQHVRLRHERLGLHPAGVAAALFTPVLLGRQPEPVRTREVGRGLARGIAAAAIVVLALVPLIGDAATSRTQRLYVVPARDPFTSPLVSGTLVAPSATVLLGEARDGVSRVDLDTFHIAREEGPPPSGPGGAVTHLAASAAGEALALVSAAGARPAVAARDLDGTWHPWLEASADEVACDRFTHLVPGLGKPVMLAGPEHQVVVYDEVRRALRVVVSEPIVGDIVDVAGTDPAAFAAIATRAASYRLAPATDGVDVTRLAPLPAGRSARAISVGSDGLVTVVASDGSAWTSARDEAGWRALRAGGQGVSLDAVDVAALGPISHRLWLVNDDSVLTRALPLPPDGPAAPLGWQRLDVALAGVGARTAIQELRNDGLVIATPARDGDAGSVMAFRVDALALHAEPLHAKDWTVLDASDSPDARRMVVLVDEAGNKRSIFDYAMVADARQTPTRITTTRRSVALPKDAPVVLGAADGIATAVFADGSFIRFDAEHDALLPAGADTTRGTITWSEPSIDGAVRANGGRSEVVLLQRDGALRQTLIDDKGASAANVVVSASSPPASLLTAARGVITHSEGLMIAAPGHVWRYTLGAPESGWTEATSADQPLLTFDADGRPLVIGKVGQTLVRAVRAAPGTPITEWSVWNDDEVMLGVGTAAFFRRGPDLQFVGKDFEQAMFLRGNGSGPAAPIVDAHLRPSHVDYFDGRLHSYTRATGMWSASREIGADHRLGVGHTANEQLLFVLPGATQSAVWVVHGDEGAYAAKKLSYLEVSDAIALDEGVLGHVRGNGLAYVGVDERTAMLNPTDEPSIDIAEVAEVVAYNAAFWVRGADGTLVRYDPRARTSMAEAVDVRALEVSTSALFGRSAKLVVRFDGGGYASWSSDDPIVALGVPLGAEAPAVTERGAVVRVAGGEARAALSASAPAPSDIERVVTRRDELFLFGDGKGVVQGASGAESFRVIAGLEGKTLRALIGPGDEVAVETESGWTVDGLPVGKSLGWSARGRIALQDGVLYEQAGTGLAFNAAPPSLVEPRAFVAIDGDHVLVLGQSGAAVFDVKRRSFVTLVDEQAFDARATFFRMGSKLLVQGANGRFTAVDADGGMRSEFGDHAIFEARAFGADGAVFANQPPASQHVAVEVEQALVADGRVWRRLRDGSIDAYDVATNAVQASTARVSGLAKVGDRLVFRRDDALVDGRGTVLDERSEHWFAGRDHVALCDTTHGVRVLDESGAHLVAEASEPLPGPILGSDPGSTVVMCAVGRDQMQGYDVMSGRVTTPLVPRGPVPALAPPLELSDGQLAVDLGDVHVALGEPRPGERFAHHVITGCATLGPRDVVIADGRRRLWRVSARGREPLGLDVERFAVEPGGTLVAETSNGDVALALERDQVVSVPVGDGERVPDFAHLPGRLGPLSWSWSDGTTVFSVAGFATTATRAGFGAFRAHAFARAKDELLVVLTLPGVVVAPITDGAVRWSEARVRDDVTAASAEPLRDSLALADGTRLVRRAGAVTMVLGERSFEFEHGRFTLDACRAATMTRARLVTACGDGTTIITRPVDAEGALGAATLLPTPPTPIEGLAPGDGGDEIVARGKQAWRLVMGKWSTYEAPTLVAAKKSRWRWGSGRTFRLDKQRYTLDAAGDFPCARPDPDPSLLSAMITSADTVAYRVRGGWCQVTDKRMPTPLATPPVRPAPPVNQVAELTIERRPQPGASGPKFSYRMPGGPPLEGTFRLVDGLLPEVDSYGSGPLVPIGPVTALVPLAAPGLVREVTVSGERVNVSPPRRAANEQPVDHRPVRTLGHLRVSDDFALERSDDGTDPAVSFGRPSAAGFAPFDGKTARPLGVTATDAWWIAAGKVWRRARDAVYEHAWLAGDAPELGAAAWRRCGDRLALAFDTPAGPLAFDAAKTPTFRPCDGPVANLADTSAGPPLDVVLDREHLQVTRSGGEPLMLEARADGLELAFAHRDASRVVADADGFTTFTRDGWRARYALRNGRYVLASVRRDDVRAPDEVVLSSGLRAMRGDDGYRLETRIGGASWPLDALLGPSRITLRGDTLVEVGAGWWRTRALSPIAKLASSAVPIATRMLGEAPPPDDERLGGRHGGTLGPWSMELPSATGTVAIGYDGHPLVLGAEGSLDVDYAITAHDVHGRFVLDRAGLASATSWTRHDPAVASALATAQPTVVRLREADRAPALAHPPLVLPTRAADAVVLAGGRLARGATRGTTLAATLDADGALRITRHVGLGALAYPPLPLAWACVRGAFVFDQPRDVFALAENGQGHALALQTLLGTEVVSATDTGRVVTRLTLAPPEASATAYTRHPTDVWLASRGLDATLAGELEHDLGGHLVVEHDQRLFVFGERGSWWIELGSRWADQPARLDAD